MKILVINPNSDEKTDEILRQKAETVWPDGHEIQVTHLHSTPLLISSYRDCAYAAREILDVIEQNEHDFDAFVIACHSDPGLAAAREVTRKPVWAIGEASMKLAGFFGDRFAVIVPSVQAGVRKNRAVRDYYCDNQYICSFVTKSDGYQDLLEAGRQACAKGAHVLVLGCANYAKWDGKLEQELGVPVLDGLVCALSLATGWQPYRMSKQLETKKEERQE